MIKTDITIELPEELSSLLEKTIFDLDEIMPDALNKYLFYMPEVMRIYGLAVAQLKHNKAEIELEVNSLEGKLKRVEADLMNRIMNGIDAHKYRNEQMRNAAVFSDPSYLNVIDEISGKKKEIIEYDYEISVNQDLVYKYRNMLSALDNIAKLRISERKY
jgi:hypothetical protein